MIMEILILSFEKILLDYKNNINKELLNVYNNGPNNIKEPIYHILHGGKRLRPILCMMTAKSLGVDLNNKNIISAIC